MGFKAVLFDFDGTLVDSEPVHMAVWNEVLGAFGLWFSEEEYRARFVGRVSSDAAVELVREYALPLAPGRLEEEKEDRYLERVRRDGLPWRPGARDALALLRGRSLRLAVVTGSPGAGVRCSLERDGAWPLFETMVSRDDVLRGKPDPESYHVCLARMGLAPADCVAVEDSTNGVLAAVGAGLRCWSVPGPFSRDHDFSLAERVFPDLAVAVASILGE